MATLVGNVNASDALWTISADLDDAIDYLQVNDEVVRVAANFHSSIYTPTGETTTPKIRVERAAGGTTAASHTNGATLTPVIPPSTGTGGEGETNVYVQSDDPGAVGAGKLWVDTTDFPVPPVIRFRSTDDDAWFDLLEDYRALGAVELRALDAILRLRRYAADGTTIRAEVAMEPGDTRLRAMDEAGTVVAEWEVSTDGLGTQLVDDEAIVRVTHEASAGENAEADARWEWTVRDAASAEKARITLNETGVHFGGVVPEVPASPTEQDIVDALLALGLVTQAAP